MTPNCSFPERREPTSHLLDFVLEIRNVEGIGSFPATGEVLIVFEGRVSLDKDDLYPSALDLLNSPNRLFRSRSERADRSPCT